MNILVTGGAGFIGSHLVGALITRGHDVTVLDDLSVGKNLTSGSRLVQGSILNTKVLSRCVRETELIYHLAAVVGVQYVLDNPLKAMAVNIRGTENVLEAAYEHGARIVIASSSEVYGKSMAMPLQEDDDRLLGPTTVNRWSYSASKAIDEYIALAYAQMGLPVSIVRYFNVYGPRMDPRGYGSVIAKFITQARRGEPLSIYGDGKQTRCFTYVADAVEGTICAGLTRGRVFNIGSDQETDINALARLVVDLTKSRSSFVYEAYAPRFEEPRRRVPDIARAREELGFEAQTTLKEGLIATLRSIT